jgi:hypothetical protein
MGERMKQLKKDTPLSVPIPEALQSEGSVTLVVEFIHWKTDIQHLKYEMVTCDFCQERPTAWYCDFLVTGYCEECMREQMKEYKKEGMGLTPEGRRGPIRKELAGWRRK